MRLLHQQGCYYECTGSKGGNCGLGNRRIQGPGRRPLRPPQGIPTTSTNRRFHWFSSQTLKSAGESPDDASHGALVCLQSRSDGAPRVLSVSDAGFRLAGWTKDKGQMEDPRGGTNGLERAVLARRRNPRDEFPRVDVEGAVRVLSSPNPIRFSLARAHASSTTARRSGLASPS